MCQDLWEALGKQRGMKHKLCCQETSQLMTKTVIVWMRFYRVGWTKSHTSTERVFIIDQWLPGYWELSQIVFKTLSALRVRRVLLEEELGIRSIPSRSTIAWHVQGLEVYCGWTWMRQNEGGLLGYVKSLWSFMNLSLGESGRQVLRWHPVINSLCSLLLCVWVDPNIIWRLCTSWGGYVPWHSWL